jgi:hypothetical protein
LLRTSPGRSPQASCYSGIGPLHWGSWGLQAASSPDSSPRICAIIDAHVRYQEENRRAVVPTTRLFYPQTAEKAELPRKLEGGFPLRLTTLILSKTYAAILSKTYAATWLWALEEVAAGWMSGANVSR